jgi:hypothetical protein
MSWYLKYPHIRYRFGLPLVAFAVACKGRADDAANTVQRFLDSAGITIMAP